MTEAIFGLLGVVIGGLLTAGTDLVARRAAARQAQQLAARVLFDELANVVASARRSIKTQRPELTFSDVLQLPVAWREHRRDLGRVGWDVWIAVDHAVASLQTTTPPTVWTQERGEWLATLAADAERALAVLEPLAAGRRRPPTQS